MSPADWTHAALSQQQANALADRTTAATHVPRARLGVHGPLSGSMLLHGKLTDLLVGPVLVLPDYLRSVLKTLGNQSFVKRATARLSSVRLS